MDGNIEHGLVEGVERERERERERELPRGMWTVTSRAETNVSGVHAYKYWVMMYIVLYKHIHILLEDNVTTL